MAPRMSAQGSSGDATSAIMSALSRVTSVVATFSSNWDFMWVSSGDEELRGTVGISSDMQFRELSYGSGAVHMEASTGTSSRRVAKVSLDILVDVHNKSGL